MASKRYLPKKAKPRNTLPEIAMMLRPHNGKDVRIAKFSGSYFGALKEMEKHYWHSRFFSDITFAPITTKESLDHTMFDKSIAHHLFGTARLNLGLYVRISEGVYINPGKTVNKIPKEWWEPQNFELDLEGLRKLRGCAKKVNNIYLGENGFAFAPWESFRTSRSWNDYIEAEEFAKGGLARAIEHTSEKVAPVLYKIVSSCRSKEVLLKYWDSPEKPVIGDLQIGYQHADNYTFQIDGESCYDRRSFKDDPGKNCYFHPQYGRVWGRLATNKGKQV